LICRERFETVPYGAKIRVPELTDELGFFLKDLQGIKSYTIFNEGTSKNYPFHTQMKSSNYYNLRP
jgi:hypothetical protein